MVIRFDTLSRVAASLVCSVVFASVMLGAAASILPVA